MMTAVFTANQNVRLRPGIGSESKRIGEPMYSPTSYLNRLRISYIDELVVVVQQNLRGAR